MPIFVHARSNVASGPPSFALWAARLRRMSVGGCRAGADEKPSPGRQHSSSSKDPASAQESLILVRCRCCIMRLCDGEAGAPRSEQCGQTRARRPFDQHSIAPRLVICGSGRRNQSALCVLDVIRQMEPLVLGLFEDGHRCRRKRRVGKGADGDDAEVRIEVAFPV